MLPAWWMFHARIMADSDNLRWRGFFGWKSVRWQDVQDYNDRLPSQSHGRNFSRAVIKTTQGSLSFGSQWTNVEAFREQVKHQAIQAAAQEWSVFWSRSCDPWPRVFRYDTWQNIWTPRLLLALILPGLIYFIVIIVTRLNQTVSLAGMVGWPMKLGLFAPYLLIFLIYAGPILLIYGQCRVAGRRKTERITADTHGIVFNDGVRQVKTTWADVTGYGIVHGPGALVVHYVVDTRQDGFDFLPSLSHVLLLKAIIRRYAVSSADTDWRPRVDLETLGGETARWSGGRVGVGARVYHYRTRSYRALLWLPAAWSLTMLLMAVLAGQGLTRGTNSPTGPIFFGTGMGLVFLISLYAYRTCRMETDEDGLTQITPWGRRRLLWSQVEDYWLTGEGNGIMQGRGERLWFGKGIVGYEELKEEIARRATECGGREWVRRPAEKRRQAGRDGRARKSR